MLQGAGAGYLGQQVHMIFEGHFLRRMGTESLNEAGYLSHVGFGVKGLGVDLGSGLGFIGGF